MGQRNEGGAESMKAILLLMALCLTASAYDLTLSVGIESSNNGTNWVNTGALFITHDDSSNAPNAMYRGWACIATNAPTPPAGKQYVTCGILEGTSFNSITNPIYGIGWVLLPGSSTTIYRPKLGVTSP